MNRLIHPEEAWAHAGQAFARDAERLVRAQDEQGLDVVLHLFALYARERHGIELDAVALDEADARVRDWREQVVRPLRAVRRTLRGAGADALRARVQQAELEAERRQLDLLCAWLQERVATRG